MNEEKNQEEVKEENEVKELQAIVFENLVGCARCGGDHKNYMVKQFRNPSVSLKDGVEIVHNFWSWCPVADEPNFFYVDIEVQEHGGDVVEEGADKPK